MAQQTINNGDSGLDARDKINENFTERYDQIIEVNSQNDSYTLVLTDRGKRVEINKVTSTTLTVPTNTSVAFTTGTRIFLKRVGAGTMTIAGVDGSVTITGSSGSLTDCGQNVEMVLIKTGTNTWDLQNGIPGSWIDYVPTWAGFSAAPTVLTARYFVIGKTCTVTVICSAHGTSNATTLTVTLPFPAAVVSHMMWCFGTNNSAALTTPGRFSTTVGSNIASAFTNIASAAWTASGSKSIGFTVTYEIQ